MLALALLLAASAVLAQDPRDFKERHYENFVEGEDLTTSLAELDMLIFTYYGENYTSRILGVYEESAMVRVEKKAVELMVDGIFEFDIDDEGDLDMSVELLSTGSGAATLEFILYKKPWDVDDDTDNATDSINHTTNSTNNISNISNSAASNPQASGNNTQTSSSSTSSINAAQQNASNQQLTQNQTASPVQTQQSPTGGTVVNINFNIALPQGSGIGLLIIIAIVLGGLLVYKKLRKKIDD